jgi:glyoxylase-like metal-dependent hydrolase (beta-lactamase superfamily II)
MMELELEAAAGVHRVEDAYTNWYLVEDGDRELVAVDAGVRSSWSSLQSALGRLGRSSSDLSALVLTHAHFDHLGFAERARRELGVEVWVHENDAPLTRHPMQYGHERSRLPYLANPKAMPIMAALVSGGAFWPTPVRQVNRYGHNGERLPAGLQPVFSPGHTLGHCALHLPERNALFAGDAVVMLDPYTGAAGPRIVAGAATADSKRALDSLDHLAATGAATILTGHGPAWREGAESAAEAARRNGSS